MAGSVNKVILVGNLGADPDIRRLNSGDQVASLRIATSESWRDRNTGERRERTEWHSVVIFNDHLVKVTEQYLKKGSKIYLEGQLQTRKWQDQHGADRYTTEIVLQKYRGELHMLDGRASRGAGGAMSGSMDNGHGSAYAQAGHDYAQHSAQGGSQSSGEMHDFSRDLDDDVPF